MVGSGVSGVALRTTAVAVRRYSDAMTPGHRIMLTESCVAEAALTLGFSILAVSAQSADAVRQAIAEPRHGRAGIRHVERRMPQGQAAWALISLPRG
jgi:hypothetical protein